MDQNAEERKLTPCGISYSECLQLDLLLSCQTNISPLPHTTNEEHFFIIIHQVHELWFKQIIYEIDSVRSLLNSKEEDERKMVKITSRLDRVVLILRLLLDHLTIMETMSPLDFFDFRDYLVPASGFHSVQFRLIENKLGIKNEDRVNFEKKNYREAFKDPKAIDVILQSEKEPSLCDLIQRWLERTPGLEENGFNFWKRYEEAVSIMLDRFKEDSEVDSDISEARLEKWRNKKERFETLFDVKKYNTLLARGQRRFTQKAFQGAMMIFCYQDVPLFHQYYRLLTLLMDIDSLILKWRYGHSQMVQKMIGSKHGTGGSSGYQYLLSTASDRYKVFGDLFNLPSFLLPRKYLPELTPAMKRYLSIMKDTNLNNADMISGNKSDATPFSL
ncbi:tryptophan 2,3-dioxygenase-like [Tachypleus tridentatus]|uniref:tryptophan 2,3-dioxygenase-like n=1 Tax=Tachypleus tridentatus TaxID=6853 RepID=UPI003FD228CE